MSAIHPRGGPLGVNGGGVQGRAGGGLRPACQGVGRCRSGRCAGHSTILRAQVVAHHHDGLSELSTAAGALWLPQGGCGRRSNHPYVFRAGCDLSRARPKWSFGTEYSTRHNHRRWRYGDGPGAMVVLTMGEIA